MKLKAFLVKFISFYQKFISSVKKYLQYIGFLGISQCVFYPTCSEYSKQAIKKYGILKGLVLSIYRISRCHPWQKKHLDPLP